MVRYLIRRLAAMLMVLIGISMLSFSLIYLVPGNAVDVLMGGEGQVSEARRLQLEHLLGLDKPPVVQYFVWLGKLLTGDLGTSIRSGLSVSQELAMRLPVTLELAIGAIIISVIVAVPLGVISAVRRNSSIDSALKLTGLIGLSVPQFGLAVLMLLVVSKYFPSMMPGVYQPFLKAPLAHLQTMFLPVLCAAAPIASVIMRMTRSSILDVVREQYVATARAKGISEMRVILKHVLANALVPVVTITGIQFGLLLSGVVVIEYIFTLPGLGTLMLNGIFQRDYTVVQSCIVVVAFLFTLVNFLVDLSYGVLDPRIRYE
ncbi:MAG: binding-protein-dependent transport system inner rane component [Rhizobium sp.]|nr:binding-protein-dependent transport system inner rane component [Rhizobium sp.]